MPGRMLASSAFTIHMYSYSFNNTQTWHLALLKKGLLWRLWLYLGFHTPAVLISVGVWPSGWLVGTSDAVKLKSSPVLQRKQWNKTCNNPKMSTQTTVFVRVTRFQSKPHSSLQFCILREGEPDGFDTGECAADAAVLACKPASLREGGNTTRDLSV